MASLALVLIVSMAWQPPARADVQEAFESLVQADTWGSLTDSVMGGVSVSRVVAIEGGMAFRGTVSTENNGGFASAYAPCPVSDLSAYDGLRFRIRGDGKNYAIRLRGSRSWSVPSYTAPLTAPEGAWVTVVVPFASLEARYRGALVPNAPPIDLVSVTAIGLHIGDKQAGDFSLEVAAIEPVVENADPDTEALEAMRWHARPLVLFAPHPANPEAIRFRDRIAAVRAAFDDRDMVLIECYESEHRYRRRFGVPVETVAAILVGKDGGEKARYASAVELDDAFALIDTMPMRQNEVQARARE